MYTIKIVRGNIVNVTAEAIVCPANNNLMPGAGANKMIFYAAGDKLIEACSKQKYCKTGSAIYTQSFNIPAKYIIHAVGPYWHGGYNGEAKDLASTYISIMKIAEQLKVKSLAIPSLCTGYGGYPIDEAVDIAVSSVISFLQTHDLDMEVWFICYDHETLLKYRTKNMEGVNDVSKYFDRNEINLNVKMTSQEKKLLKKKLFKKEVLKEQETAALNAVLKRVIRKKYPECVYLAPPKTKNKITMKTVEKHEVSGPFITMDCVNEFSYDSERMKIRITPFSFVDTPEELESKKRYFTDEDLEKGDLNYDIGQHHNEEQKTIKVVNIENLLANMGNEEELHPEVIETQVGNVEIGDMADMNDNVVSTALENTDEINIEIAEEAYAQTANVETDVVEDNEVEAYEMPTNISEQQENEKIEEHASTEYDYTPIANTPITEEEQDTIVAQPIAEETYVEEPVDEPIGDIVPEYEETYQEQVAQQEDVEIVATPQIEEETPTTEETVWYPQVQEEVETLDETVINEENNNDDNVEEVTPVYIADETVSNEPTYEEEAVEAEEGDDCDTDAPTEQYVGGNANTNVAAQNTDAQKNKKKKQQYNKYKKTKKDYRPNYKQYAKKNK